MSEAMGAMKQIAIEKLNKEEEEKLSWKKHQRKLSKLTTIKAIKAYCKEHGLVYKRANFRVFNLNVSFETYRPGVKKHEFDIRETYDLRISRKGERYRSEMLDIPIVSIPWRGDGLHDWIRRDFFSYVQNLIVLGGCQKIERSLYHDHDGGFSMEEFSRSECFDDLSGLYYLRPDKGPCDHDEAWDVDPDVLIRMMFGWDDLPVTRYDSSDSD